MNMAPEKRTIRVVAALIQDEEGRVLITQRRPGAFMPLRWEFPGGKVETGESDQQALQRELEEELDIRVEVNQHFMALVHSYPEFNIDFQVYRCKITDGAIKKKAVADFRWASVGQLDEFEFPPADEPTVKKLLNIFT